MIPCANDDYSLFLCVQAIAEAVDEVVLLDDASEDQTRAAIDWLRARYPHVHAKRVEVPLGWAETRNVLAEMTDARHLFFIDADDILLDKRKNALKSLVDSPAEYVRLGLAEMWGDFHHGTGRGLEWPHFDPCHVYVDRAVCTDARWTCVMSHAKLATSQKPTYATDVLFWHAKGVKSDWRLVARTHTRAWIADGRRGQIGAWPPLALDRARIHEQAVRRLLGSRLDPIRRIPDDTPIPQVCVDNERFHMVYQENRIVDRTDMGWKLR